MKTKQRVENAIKWIDSLKGGKRGFKKTTAQLGEDIDGDGKPDRFCCLGVGCKVLNIKYVDFEMGVEERLVNMVGLYDSNGSFKDKEDINDIGALTDVNDNLYEDDETFTNIRKFILKHLDKIFIPSVAKELIKHYKK